MVIFKIFFPMLKPLTNLYFALTQHKIKPAVGLSGIIMKVSQCLPLKYI